MTFQTNYAFFNALALFRFLTAASKDFIIVGESSGQSSSNTGANFSAASSCFNCSTVNG